MVEFDISNNAQLEEIKKLLTEHNTKLTREIEKLKSDHSEQISKFFGIINKLEDCNCQLKQRVDFLERKIRKNNIVIFGLPDSDLKGSALVDWFVKEIKSLLLIDLSKSDISNAYFKGKQSRKKVLVVEFSNYLTKTIVLKNAYKLKGKHVSMTHDLSKADQEINKVLVSNLKEAKAKKLVAYIKNNCLHIGEEVFTYDHLKNQADAKLNAPEELTFSPPPLRKILSAPSTPTVPVADNENETETEIITNSDKNKKVHQNSPAAVKTSSAQPTKKSKQGKDTPIVPLNAALSNKRGRTASTTAEISISPSHSVSTAQRSSARINDKIIKKP